MQSDSGTTTSLWMATAEVPEANTMPDHLEADVCIVGGGRAGSTTAYLLTRDGKSVAVLDDGLLGGGETCRTTAHRTVKFRTNVQPFAHISVASSAGIRWRKLGIVPGTAHGSKSSVT